MNENILKEILAEICEEEIAELDKLPPFKTSLRHRLAMKRIFARFERNTRKAVKSSSPTLAIQNTRKRPITRLILISVIIACAALLTGAVVIYFSKSFHGTVYPDNTHLFANNTENCPTTIEHTYYLSELPGDFEMVEQTLTQKSVFTQYENASSGQSITLIQCTKDSYNAHYNTEYRSFEEIDINGHAGMCLDFSDDEHFSTLIVWDNGDYILEIVGDFPKNYLVNLAKSAKVLKK